MTAMSADERQELAKSVRSVCERMSPEERVRAVAYGEGDENGDAPSGFDVPLWDVLCNQVGVAAIALPEHLGGAGYGPSALGVVAHELGRALAPVPFVSSTVLATGLLLELTERDPDAEKRFTGLVEGRRTAAAALTGDGGMWRRSAVTLSAVRDGDGWRVDGTVRHVLGGTAADDLVVVATAGDGEPAVFLLDPAVDGVAVEAERVLDGTRPMATITLSAVPAVHLSGGVPGGVPVDDVIERNIDIALAVLSAEQVGACERVLEIATAYARTREQFGRPIGSFQAIKHKCADMLVDLEWARSASLAALQAVEGSEDGGLAEESDWRASMAKAVCSESLRSAANANVQIHGGIGFTWEDSAHLYLRRARTDEVVLGTPAQHWDRLGVIVSTSPDVIGGIAAGRAEIRSFLADAPKPAGLRNYGPTPTADDVAPGRTWHRYLADHGYTCLHWPVEFGGAAATVAFQAVFAEECARAGVPRQLNITGADLVGPVLIKFGSQAQKDRYLDPIRLGDGLWCQLFSEPGAGSDLASVRTRAERTPTGWRIDGQKVWSSAAAAAHYGLLLARTGPDKHRDLSMFVIPMDIPGVAVHPLVQMDGESKFNEVFFDGAELGDDALIGDVGQGWAVAMVTLGRERLTLGSQAVSMFRLHEQMVDAARAHDLLDPVLARSLTKLWSRMWLLRFTWLRAIDSGDLSSSAFSVLKLMTSETDRDLGDMATEVLGTDACIDPADNDLVHHMLVGRAQTILGGTSEIQRNILGERVLGLPKNPDESPRYGQSAELTTSLTATGLADALRAALHPGMTVALGDGVGGLQCLDDGASVGAALSAAAREVGSVRLVLGWLPSPLDGLDADAFAEVIALMPGWGVRELMRSPNARFLPTRLAAIPALLADVLRPSVLLTRLVQCSGPLQFSTEVSWQHSVIDSGARLLGLIDTGAPAAAAGPALETSGVEVLGTVDGGPLKVRQKEPDLIHDALADAVLRFIPEGARLQYGPGQFGAALLRRARIPLAIDTGLLTDAVVDLDRRGLLTGTPSATYLFGSELLYDWADGQPILRGIEYTHDFTRLSRGAPLIAVNTAIEIDPFGQINVEGLGDKVIGGIGGHPDYCAAGRISSGGLSIIVVPSRVNGRSPLVEQLSRPASTPAYDVDLIVTESGHADLRAADWSQRRALITALFA